jgi:peroxiredoxin (alkyl hydroperoxide reductase subunit C)
MNNNCENYEEIINVCSCPRLGEEAPDFDAETTHGEIKFSEYNKGSWIILFSHPADFTPVCTTEFVGFAEKQEEFDKRNTKLIGLSIDSVFSHIAWVRTIEKNFEVKIKFPVIADLLMEVAHTYGMIHPAVSDVHAVRTIFIIDPKGIIRFMVSYPQSVGRNIDEIIRILDALQLIDKENIATPANWKQGENVIVTPPKTVEEAEERMKGQYSDCKEWFLCKTKV